jgi:hypothetical protein
VNVKCEEAVEEADDGGVAMFGLPSSDMEDVIRGDEVLLLISPEVLRPELGNIPAAIAAAVAACSGIWT